MGQKGVLLTSVQKKTVGKNLRDNNGKNCRGVISAQPSGIVSYQGTGKKK